MHKSYIGIDIGTRQVKMVQCQGHVLCREETEPLPEYFMKDGKMTSMEAMADFLKNMAKNRGIKCRSCCLVLPDNLTLTRRVHMPAMTVNQLNINLPYEFHDFIQDKRETYIFDYAVMETVRDQNKKPVSMDLMAAAVSKRVMEEYRQMLRLAGWKLKSAAPAAFAYSNLIRDYEKREDIREPKDYCLVDLGYLAARVFFFHGKGLKASRRIDISPLAEDEPEMYESIGTELRRTVDYYRFRNPKSRITEVCFCGGRALNEAVCGLVAEYASLKPGYAKELISVSEGMNKTVISPAAAGSTFWL